MLYKKGSAIECGNYKTNALISHTSKILIIILNRIKIKVEKELYQSNRGTIDMLFSLQLLIEKVRKSEDEVFIIFIDYSVHHN